MAVLEIYLEILTNFFEILYPPLHFMSVSKRFIYNLKLNNKSSEESVTFLDIKVNLTNESVTTDLDIKPTDKHQYFHSCFLIQTTPKQR